MDGRLLDYRPIGGGLDYHHNSPLIGEIPNGEYSHVVHRSIDQLRNSLNERVTLGPLSVFSNSTDLRNSVLAYNSHQSNVALSAGSGNSGSNGSGGGTVIGGSGSGNNNGENRMHYDIHRSSSLTDHHHKSNTVGCMDDSKEMLHGDIIMGSNAGGNGDIVGNSTSEGMTNGSGMMNVQNGENIHMRCINGGQDSQQTQHQQQQQPQQRTARKGRPPTLHHAVCHGNSNSQRVSQNHQQHHHHHSNSSSPHGHDMKDSKIFSSKADLQLHTQIHMREAKPYKCSQCSKAFANSSYLSQHTRIHLGIKPYRCEICQRKFTQLSHLQQHIRTHTGDKPYKCRHPGCQKAFSQLSNLQSHSRCHQTDKPYKCNSCYKCFSDEPSLLEHIPKHKESKHLKTHICQYCGKSYTQETYLTKHMQKHSERTDKRPPITGGPSSTTSGSNGATPGANGGGSGGGGGGGGNGGGGTTSSHGGNLNRNIGLNTSSLPPVAVGDHPYWPKVSPDSAATITDVMHHHQHQHLQQQTQQGQPSHLDQFPSLNSHPPSQTNGHSDLQTHHRMNENGREDIVSTPSTVGPYDSTSITKTTSNSAFTPINSMTPHLNTLSHHPMAQRPYLYDAISFQNKNVNQNNANSFPNQLISLHQIRNYAHQPAGLMTGEHLIGVSVGSGKDKG